MIPPVVGAAEIPPGAVLADVRYYLDGRDGPTAYVGGHLPGARYVDLDSVLASEPAPILGRHPLPSPERFAHGLGAQGIARNDVVVAYDDTNGVPAARLVWMLRILGHDAAVLDGGLAAWPGELETGWPLVEPVERDPEPWPDEATVDADEVAALAEAGGVVADSRAAARYEGALHPLDTVSGHIPGAVSLPFEQAAPGGRYKSPRELAEHFDRTGVDADSVFYCGSGVSACVNVLAAERAGLGRPRLYVGSWSGWTSDPARPVEH